MEIVRCSCLGRGRGGRKAKVLDSSLLIQVFARDRRTALLQLPNELRGLFI